METKKWMRKMTDLSYRTNCSIEADIPGVVVCPFFVSRLLCITHLILIFIIFAVYDLFVPVLASISAPLSSVTATIVISFSSSFPLGTPALRRGVSAVALEHRRGGSIGEGISLTTTSIKECILAAFLYNNNSWQFGSWTWLRLLPGLCMGWY